MPAPNINIGLILGIESSCDETAAAVVRGGHQMLSNVVASQMEMHALYGGVVPELASREHLRNIVPVVREALSQAGVDAQQLDAVAVTSGPGLAGALLVGISFAKAYAFGLGKPLIAVNHLEGHIHAVLMQRACAPLTAERAVPDAGTPADPSASLRDDKAESRGELAGSRADEPLLALVVSGGHTHLYLAQWDGRAWSYRNVGRTVDDAAGEAYDKVAKLLGLGYPGGPWIDRLSAFGNAAAVSFRFTEINRGTAAQPSFDFSFSGIKTAVLRYVETHGMRDSIEQRRAALAQISDPDRDTVHALCDEQTLNLIAAFQNAVVGNLLRQALAAANFHRVRGIVVSGGVAANRELRRRFAEQAAARGLHVDFPAPALSTDNAAMIAAAAWPRLLTSDFADATLNASPQQRLDAAAPTALG